MVPPLLSEKTSYVSNGIFSFVWSNGDIRKITNKEEIIQRIYFAVRDKEWLNIPYTINQIGEKESGTRKIFSYRLDFYKQPVDFEAHITLTLDKDRLTLEAHGKANTTFLKNRIGFCVNLPGTLKGKSCKIRHTDGTTISSVFPQLISPHQPFKHISSVQWTSPVGLIELTFTGDTFEMEDQRNWTDASYKIYSTPLDEPFPVKVLQGSTFYQKIVLSVIQEKSLTKKTLSGKKNLEINKTIPPPALGLADQENIFGSASSLSDHSYKLPFSYYRIDFPLYHPTWKDQVTHGIMKASFFHLPIHATLYIGENFDRETENFIRYIQSFPSNIRLHSITLLSTQDFIVPKAILQEVVPILKSIFPGTLVGSGTDANFAQINRNRPEVTCLDFICYSIQPQEHASDPLSIIENIQGQSDTVQTACSFSDGKAICISSLSFFRRFNANVEVISKNKFLPKYPYQNSLLEAGWFVGSFHQLITAGARLITCVCKLQKASPLGSLFEYLAIHTPENYFSCGSLKPEQYSVLSWESKGQTYSVFANHTDTSLKIIHPYGRLKLGPYGLSCFPDQGI
ncbi:hypothetical protein [Parabacteroides pacaensis]|uniref:hypothetical protein n=1 Tax=Parabacteroides pacaensis TaxID=2086575 RepID=UPI000D0FA271|nr:hypothetical protein [Parabacteroides pacaensis]